MSDRKSLFKFLWKTDSRLSSNVATTSPKVKLPESDVKNGFAAFAIIVVIAVAISGCSQSTPEESQNSSTITSPPPNSISEPEKDLPSKENIPTISSSSSSGKKDSASSLSEESSSVPEQISSVSEQSSLPVSESNSVLQSESMPEQSTPVQSESQPDPTPVPISEPESDPEPELEPEPEPEQISSPSEGATSPSNAGSGASRPTYNYSTGSSWVVNNNTKKIHWPSCSSVKTIKPENYGETDDIEMYLSLGYEKCKRCF